MTKILKLPLILLLIGFATGAFGADNDALPKPGEQKTIHFSGASPMVKNKCSEVQYEFDLANESFTVFVPKTYSDGKPAGLFTFIDSQNEAIALR